jgi:hypothetical protein
MVYQTLQQHHPISLQELLQIPGNKVALDNLMNYIIMPSAIKTQTFLSRQAARRDVKNDMCIFEQPLFQRKVNEHFRDECFVNEMSRRGVIFYEIDVSRNICDTIASSVELFYKIVA